MIKAKVNQSEFDVEIISETEIKLNSESNQLDVISLSNSKKHLILGNKSYSIEYVSFDKEKKEAVLKVNNSTYKVALKDKYDLLL